MNLIGKILVTLVFVMSLVWLGFAVTVYSTHQNWKEKAANLKKDIATREQQKTELQTKLTEETKRLQGEITAAQDLIGKAQTERDKLTTAVAAQQTEIAAKEEAIRQAVAAAQTANQNLAAADAKVEKLRQDIEDIRKQRDDNFKSIVALTDEKNSLLSDKSQLDAANANLADQVAKAKLVLDRNGLSINTNVDGVPPKVDGIVLQVADDLIEMSIGSDDGLSQGHTLDVSRSSKYIGRVSIVRTSPDRSVGKIIPGYIQGKIEKDDRVSTRIK